MNSHVEIDHFVFLIEIQDEDGREYGKESLTGELTFFDAHSTIQCYSTDRCSFECLDI